MDSPCVYWKIFNNLSEERQGTVGRSLLNIKSYGLHTRHKVQVNLVEYFRSTTDCTLLPLKFCGHFKTLLKHEQDRLVTAKLRSLIFVAKIFWPFVTRFQIDESLSPFLDSVFSSEKTFMD